MRMYDTLIACLVKYKNFKEIKKDEFLHSLYQIWDMVFWDDEDDISPMKAYGIWFSGMMKTISAL